MILFVCTGNTCRSPMAEAIAKQLFLQNDLTHKVFSRGIAVFSEDSCASPNAIEAVKQFGATLQNHTPRQISHDDIISANIILTMTAGHKNNIIRIFPNVSSKIFTLKEYTINIESDINDPYGGSLAQYQSCAKEIYNCIEGLVKKLNN